jgi:hypothetical protein
MKYPKEIEQIMSEAPWVYAVQAVLAWKNKDQEPKQLLKKWQEYKLLMPEEDLRNP